MSSVSTQPRRWRRLLGVVAVLVGAVTVAPMFAGVASAVHHFTDGDVSCSGTISWSSVAWDDGSAGENPDVRIYMDPDNGPEVLIFSGAYVVANGNSLSGTTQWPAGATSVVISTRAGEFANGYFAYPDVSSVTLSAPGNCGSSPGVDVDVQCAFTSPGNGTGTVVLTMSNGSSAFNSPLQYRVYALDQTSGPSASYTVAGGATDTHTFTGVSDGNHSYRVEYYTDSWHPIDGSFSVDCNSPQPSASISQACADGDGTIVVTLTNTGGEAVTFTVEITGGTSEDHLVGPGGSTELTFADLPDGSYTVTVKVGDDVITSEEITISCDRPGTPDVEISQQCSNEDGAVTVTLRNIGGELPLTFTVNGQNHVVPANSSVDVVISGLTDGNHTITITQGQNDYSEQVSVDCDAAPTVGHTQSCTEGDNNIADGSVTITLFNNGDDVDVTFTVEGTEYTVGPKGSTQVVVDGLSDGVHTITVTAPGYDFSFEVTVDCDHAGEGSISIAQSCENQDGTLTITLIATGGEEPVVFTVQGVQHVVAPDSQLQVSITGLTDGNHHITVTTADSDLSFDVTVACDVSQEPPTTPRTGLPSTGGGGSAPVMLLAGLAMALAGGVMLLIRRRPIRR